MTNGLIAIGLIAFLAYGYWLMRRLDDFLSGNGRKQASTRPWAALQGALAATGRRVSSLLPEPRGAGAMPVVRGPEPRQSHTPFAA